MFDDEKEEEEEEDNDADETKIASMIAAVDVVEHSAASKYGPTTMDLKNGMDRDIKVWFA